MYTLRLECGDNEPYRLVVFKCNPRALPLTDQIDEEIAFIPYFSDDLSIDDQESLKVIFNQFWI